MSRPGSPRRGRPSRGLRALLVACLAFPLVLPAAPAAAKSKRVDDVTVSVVDVSPSTPAPSVKRRPLAVTLALTNTTAANLTGVHIDLDRGEPISTQQALDTSLADPAQVSPGLGIKPTRPVTVDIPAGESITTTFLTSTSVIDDSKGLCLCSAGAVYPLYFRAHQPGATGADQVLGDTATYLPSFFAEPAQTVQVSWVWPLIDRPHRLIDDAVFLDDDLTDSVQGGRLDRALQVAEQVGTTTPITLVIDPELLDELSVMSTGRYTVQRGTRTVPGTGQDAATQWLDRLHNVLTDDPQVQLDLTPYADPDIGSLTRRHLTWATALPPTMSARVGAALEGRSLDSDIAWPASGSINTPTLRTLATFGVSTVVLDNHVVAGAAPAGAVPRSLGTLKTPSGSVTAALTSATVQSFVRRAVSLGGTGTATLPSLVAELAVRAAQSPDTAPVAVLTPPRYVDPSVDNAVRAIRDTSTSPFTEPIALRDAAGADNRPSVPSRLAHPFRRGSGLPVTALDTATSSTARLSALNTLLAASDDAQTLLTDLPLAVQRLESSAWRYGSTQGGPELGTRVADAFTTRVDDVMAGVHIVQPSSGSYTLASGDSPLPITVQNDLGFAVEIQIDVNTVGNLPGLTTRELKQQVLQPHSKQTLHLPTRVERSGRFPVIAQLKTPDGAPLGAPVTLYVHSTALGTVGVVITIVAGAVLALALLLRIISRLRARRNGGSARKRRPAAPRPTPPPAMLARDSSS